MKRKLRNQRGESLIETFAAMCIIALGMLILAGAIVSAARVNKRAANETVQVVLPSNPASYEADTGWSVEIRDSDGNIEGLPVTLYKAVPEGGGGDGKQILYYYALNP